MRAISVQQSIWINHSPQEAWEILNSVNDWPLWTALLRLPQAANPGPSKLLRQKGAESSLSPSQLDSVRGLRLGMPLWLRWNSKPSASAAAAQKRSRLEGELTASSKRAGPETFRAPVGLGLWLGIGGQIVELQPAAKLSWQGRFFLSKAIWSLQLEPLGVGVQVQFSFETVGFQSKAVAGQAESLWGTQIQKIADNFLMGLQERVQQVQASSSCLS